ncbi:mitochondrial ubiquitin ligase activator of nfkb 1-A [Girardinichthys multiradiatus]|uniref:mitochondrial ubiquitin ligase activator of nfkb 1-A n=1 Tax=Girardinichthys multiradiatus TaxID=208333 RepID=UPI001FAE6BA3|nr:mitochondrial ubiquitin ligase activator of nfkb 1-A [Girardinichthys multiradiatus]
MDGFSLTLPEAVCLGASLGLSGIFYYLHKQSRKAVKKLDNAPHVSIDGKLKDLLKVTPGARLQYAVVEGTVKPVDEPLTSQFHKDISGVLQKFTIKEHRLVWSSISRTWMDSERILHQRVNMVPFALVGSDKAAVKVQSPLQAEGMYTETTNEKFHPASYGFGELVGLYLSGEKSKGHLEIEEMLKVGTTLIGVGELILDTDGTLTLRPPSDNSQYFLSLKDFETLRNETDTMAVWWKALTVVSALAGTAVLLWVCLRFYRTVQVRWEQEQERKEFARLQAEAARLRANRANAEGTQDGANSNHMESVCVICLNEPRDCILLDCAHVCCCYVCFQALPQKTCPICRQNIVRVLPFYQS